MYDLPCPHFLLSALCYFSCLFLESFQVERCKEPRAESNSSTTVFSDSLTYSHKPPQFAQELLSTFSVSLGEVALQPSTGGTFIVTIYHQAPGAAGGEAAVSSTVLWDRKVDGGFPETKELKRRVRDVIEPGRDLGHVDRNHGASAAKDSSAPALASAAPPAGTEAQKPDDKAKCEDCQ
jgi:predicted Rdx family selenoprotein